MEKAAEDRLTGWPDWMPFRGRGDVLLLSIGRFRCFSIVAGDAVRLGEAEAKVLSIVIVAGNGRSYQTGEVFWGGRSLTSSNFEYTGDRVSFLPGQRDTGARERFGMAATDPQQ